MTPNEELQQKIEVEVLQALKAFIPGGVHPHVELVSSSGCVDDHCADNPGSAAPSLKAGDRIVISLQSDSVQSQIATRRRFRRDDFDPIPIKGEPLSVTVIRDRR
jgi:hypothetical protein